MELLPETSTHSLEQLNMDVQILWEQLSHKKLGQVAAENGMTPQSLVALVDQAGLTGRQPADPGPDEIAARAAAIRAEWTPAIERSRWIAARRVVGSR